MKVTHLLALIMTVSLVTPNTLSQTTTTPTPAPSKTPTTTRAPTAQSSRESSDNNLPDHPLKPLTQEDLTTLTGNVQRPNGALWHNNKLHIICSGDQTIYQLNDRTGATAVYIHGVRNAHTLLIEEIGGGQASLWIPDYEANSLIRITRRGTLEQIATDLNGPWGIVYFDNENFLVTNLLGNNAVLISRQGDQKVAISDLRSPTGLATDSKHIYVANNGSSRRAIEWFTTENIGSKHSTDEDTPRPLVSGLQNVTNLVLGADGQLYFAYSLGTRGVVGRVNPTTCRENGGCTHDQVEIVVYTDLAAPLAGLTLSTDMRLFVHTIYRPEIYWAQLGTGGNK